MGKSLSLPLHCTEAKPVQKAPLSRTKSAVCAEPVMSQNVDAMCFRRPYNTPPPPLWGENLHRKLQRQLTLNPNCDPRLYHIQRQHQAASRVLSCEPLPNYPSSSHQHVTRIASAPPSHSPIQACSRPLSSASDPQLNLSTPPPALLSSWTVPPPPTTHPNTFHLTQSLDESRRKLLYHLSSIFPEEQVQTALRFYPNETNPQKICAAIISMFPPKP